MNKSTLKNLIKEIASVVLENHYEDDTRDDMGRVARPDISYEIEKKKGEIHKIIAALQAHSSGAFTKVVGKLQMIEQLEEQISLLKEEVKQEGVREKIAALFGADFQYTTRVIKLVSMIEITMSKDPKAAETTKWADVYKELYEKLPTELQVVGAGIVKKFSTTQDPKPPSIKISGPPTEPVQEGVGNWKEVLSKVSSWGHSFDEKLNHVLDGLIASAKEMASNIPTFENGGSRGN